MAETSRPVQNSTDEIDLIYVLERITRFLSQNKKELIITAIAGMLCGYIIFLATPKSYGSTLILHSQILTNSEEIEIIENWNTLLRDNEFGVLSRNLNCSPLLLSKINRVTADNIQNAQPLSGFTVEAFVKDTAILPDLQRGIIFGLENNEYVKEKVALKRSNTIKIIDQVNQEIAKLDSAKRKIESGLTGGRSAGSSPFIVDISDANVQMVKLNEKLYEYQETLKFVDAIQVLQNFEKYAQPASPRKLTLMLSGLLGGLFLGFMLALVKNVRTKIAVLRNVRQSGLPVKPMV